jgi:hypothetical protein
MRPALSFSTYTPKTERDAPPVECEQGLRARWWEIFELSTETKNKNKKNTVDNYSTRLSLARES